MPDDIKSNLDVVIFILPFLIPFSFFLDFFRIFYFLLSGWVFPIFIEVFYHLNFSLGCDSHYGSILHAKRSIFAEIQDR